MSTENPNRFEMRRDARIERLAARAVKVQAEAGAWQRQLSNMARWYGTQIAESLL